jgi:hypothetical protein
MAPDITVRSSAESPRAKSWIIAAIALVLNWTAPGHVQLPVTYPHDATSGVWSDERASQPGNLPRAQSRHGAHDASVPKPPSSRLNGGGKQYALPPLAPVLVLAGSTSVVSGVDPGTPTPIATRAFDPRAPPPLMA